MKEMDLKKYLKRFSNTEVDFYRFNGNYGDSLIWHGTLKLMEELSINLKYVNTEDGVHNNVLFIDGGGNFVDYYFDVRDFLIKKNQQYKEVIILPHTINGEKQKSLLETLNNNVTIFCRDMISYDFVKEYAKNCQVYIWHDCAFYNNFDSYKKNGTGILNAFREDCESIKKIKPKNNFDISKNGYCKKPIKDFLEEISKYEEIRTDRLHIAIASTMLGKKVIMYPNSYYKNTAVYEYSLKKYPNITFIYSEDSNLLSFKNKKNE
ncbi:MAG: polysaccharide pyruvyl transferase family protein [Candidatus Nomurabacteria bacterium]|nr:polysaccharide pyruvyl transferase family protein [Candidatus Nomurabacteria bacterium]